LKGVDMTTTLTVRIDDKLKRRFNSVVQTVGLDAPTVMRMLIVQTVNTGEIPLSLSSKPETQAAEEDTMRFLDSVRADWGEW
jgi:addiction module RelB/DinJ family antitoxin